MDPDRSAWAVIFDLDGTLVDSEPNYLAAERRLLAEYGVDFTAPAKERYVGLGTVAMMADLRVRYRIADSVDDMVARKNAYYLDLAAAATPVFPQMRALLELLRASGYRLAVASGSSADVLAAVLDSTRLRPSFDVAVSADAVRAGKPAPDLFVETACRLTVTPDRCVVVEDSRYGVQAARRAGMACIAVPSLPADRDDPDVAAADLVFGGGAAEFVAAEAFAWIERRRHAAGDSPSRAAG